MTNADVRSLPTYAYTQTLIARTHAFYADEPEEADGNDLGPTPYELLLWALGACTAMTLRMYAHRKGWPLADVVVHLRHHRVHADDCVNCDDPSARIDRIERAITLVGPLTAEQRARLLEIAARCPVHRTLTGRVQIADRLLDGAAESRGESDPWEHERPGSGRFPA
jgi:putative redox protein